MGQLNTKPTNSDPIFYDLSSNHHQNLVNLCLMMNPPFLVVHSHPAPPRHPFFTTKKLKACQVECSEPQHATEGSKLNLHGENHRVPGPLIPRGKFTFLNPKNGGRWFRWFSLKKIGWFFMVSSYLRFVGGTYPTWQVGSWFSSVSSVSSVVPGGVIGLTLEVHQEQSIDPRNKKEEVHLSDASPAVFFGGQEFWTHPTWLGRSKHNMGLHHTFHSKGLS